MRIYWYQVRQVHTQASKTAHTTIKSILNQESECIRNKPEEQETTILLVSMYTSERLLCSKLHNMKKKYSEYKIYLVLKNIKQPNLLSIST